LAYQLFQQVLGGTHAAGANVEVPPADLRFDLGVTHIQVIFTLVILGAYAFFDELAELLENCITVERISTCSLGGAAFQLGFSCLDT